MTDCDFEFHSVNPKPFAGMHEKDALFGEKRMSVQREQLAGKLSRSCRINEGRPSFLATVAVTGGTSYRFRRGPPSISQSVASRNEVVERNSKVIQFASGSPREKNRDRRLSEVGGKKTEGQLPVVDSKALTAEIDSVALELRNLIAGDTEHLVVKSTEVRKHEDEEEGETTLHAKLLRYRYVRKIEAPPPPLEPIEGTYHRGPQKVDKIELNLQKFRIGWKRDALARAQHWNKETAERIETARSRREEESERFESHLMHSMAMKEKVPQRVDALRSAQVERLKLKAAQREERLEQVRRRKVEELEARHWRLQEMLSTDRGKERTGGRDESSSPVRSLEDPQHVEVPQAVEDDVATEGKEGMDWFQSLREEDEEEEEEKDRKKQAEE